jgi:hypothetical protein
MAEPAEKSPNVEAFLDKLVGGGRKEKITSNTCVICGKPAVDFTDEVSRREYAISGLCQECQDKAFAEEDDEDDDETFDGADYDPDEDDDVEGDEDDL